MPASQKRPRKSLELRFDAAATPARVVATATFVDRLLSAVDPHLPQDSITLVVSNYSTVASVRAWTPAGDAVLNRCERILRNPVREVARHPESRPIAVVLAKAAPEIAPFHARIGKPRAKTPIATINEAFIDRVQRLAAPPTAAVGNEPPVAGGTQIYSPIYRIGRLDEGKDVHARIRVDDRPYDLRIDATAVGAAFDVAKSGATVPIDIVGGWTRNEFNGLVLDAATARIIHVGANWTPIAGAEFLDAIHTAIPDAFDDLLDVLPGDHH